MAAFSVSAFSGVVRTCKPFNALLGETYELACPEKGFRFLAEKVPCAAASLPCACTHGARVPLPCPLRACMPACMLLPRNQTALLDLKPLQALTCLEMCPTSALLPCAAVDYAMNAMWVLL